MIHPLAKNNYYRWFYLTAWTFLLVLHAALFHWGLGLSWRYALSDALVYEGLLGLFCLGIPYVAGAPFGTAQGGLFRMVSLLVSMILVLGGWLYLSHFILKQYFDIVPDASRWVFFRALQGAFIYWIQVLLLYLITYLESYHENLSQREQLQGLLKESQLQALRSQINPHFLFNSLNSISYLTLTDGEKAHEMLILLSEYLRFNLKQNTQSLVPLEEEIENCLRYLAIEKVRFQDRLLFEADIDPAIEDYEVPAMILQPLFENAIKHGVYESLNPVSIWVKAQTSDKYLQISIINNFEATTGVSKGAGVGLNNVRERLKLVYQLDGLLKTKKEDHTFTVELYIPKKVEK